MRSTKARIYDNNQLLTAGVTIVAPDDGSFPFANALTASDGKRALPWNPGSKSFTVTIDLGYNGNVSLFAIFGPSNANLGVSPSATITLKGNMINLFDGTEPFNQEATIYDNGVFLYLDTDANPEGLQYRYWNIVFDDSTNPDDLFINYIFLGDALTFEYNIQRGFSIEPVDQSIIQTSDSGVLYASQRPQYSQFTGLNHRFLSKETKKEIETTIQQVGLFTPFIFSLDPTEACFGPEDSHFLTYFGSLPRFKHVKTSVFDVSYDVREVL